MLNQQNIVACVIGNVIEWYEFTLFAYLSPIIAGIFFPTENKITSLLATFLVFAIGFVVRPLRPFILGHMGDKFGRAKTLKLTILFLSLPVTTAFFPFNLITDYLPSNS